VHLPDGPPCPPWISYNPPAAYLREPGRVLSLSGLAEGEFFPLSAVSFVMPRPKTPSTLTKHAYARHAFPSSHERAGRVDPARVFADVRISPAAWGLISEALTGRKQWFRSGVDFHRAAAAINQCLYEYALAVEMQRSGATPRAIANHLLKIKNAITQLLGLLEHRDPATQQVVSLMLGREVLDELRRCRDGDLGVGGIPSVIELMRERQPTLGRRRNAALEQLVSELALVFLDYRSDGNTNWKGFVSSVLLGAGIRHPSPSDPKSESRFDSLLSEWANKEIAGRLRRTIGAHRKASLPSMSDLILHAGEARKSDALKHAKSRGRPRRRRKGT
jgi:hypothetical protein